MENLGSSKMQVLSLAFATRPSVDGVTSTSARLGKQLFLWPMYQELGNCSALVH